MDWFTADFHFDHEAVIGMDGRPFKSQDEMHEVMIDNWNSCVAKSDRCWIIGDFTLGKDPMKYLNKMNGDIHLIWGNHDHFTKNKAPRISAFHDLKEINIDGQAIVMCHYPMLSWHHAFRGTWHLYGHVHMQAFPYDGLCINVGVMHHNYKPVSFEQLKELMKPKLKKREAWLKQLEYERSLP